MGVRMLGVGRDGRSWWRWMRGVGRAEGEGEKWSGSRRESARSRAGR